MLKQIEDILSIAIDNDSGEYCLLDTKKGQSFLYEDRQRHSWRVDLPPGSWELIGLSHLLTSEQKEMVVVGFGLNRWKNYNASSQYEELLFKSVDDSYQSWLEANGIEKNCVILKKKHEE